MSIIQIMPATKSNLINPFFHSILSGYSADTLPGENNPSSGSASKHCLRPKSHDPLGHCPKINESNATTKQQSDYL